METFNEFKFPLVDEYPFMRDFFNKYRKEEFLI